MSLDSAVYSSILKDKIKNKRIEVNWALTKKYLLQRGRNSIITSMGVAFRSTSRCQLPVVITHIQIIKSSGAGSSQ